MNTPKNNKAIDKGCCEKCAGAFTTLNHDTVEECLNTNCPCHTPVPVLEGLPPNTAENRERAYQALANPPSLSEGEELKCRRCSMKLNDCPRGRWTRPLCRVNDVEWDQHVLGLSDLETFLSQERERMVAIEEELKDELPDILHQYGAWLLNNHKAKPLERRARKNTLARDFLTAYQQKIKSLNS